MFAARVRASLESFIHGRNSSSLSRNCEIAANSRRVLLDRFNDGYRNQTSLRLTGNGVGTKLFHRAFHIYSPQCYSSESDVGVKPHTTALFSSLEDDLFSELGSVEKDLNQEMVVELLTKTPDTLQVEKPELSQKTKGRKKKNKKHEQASDSISKPKLLTEKPEASWKTNGKSKLEKHASSPARNVTDSISKPTESSSPIPDHESKAQSIVSLGSKANETSSNDSSTSITPSNHPSLVLVIRICNLNSKTTDSEIHSRCLSIGSLEGLVRVDENSVEVLFRARNMNEANSILEKLNDATVGQSQWTAEIVSEAEEAFIDQVGLRINSSFEHMEEQLRVRQILVKDLGVLVHSVIHLENHPMAGEGKNAFKVF